MSVIIDGADGLSRGGADLLYRGLPLGGQQWMDRFVGTGIDYTYRYAYQGVGSPAIPPTTERDTTRGRNSLLLDAVAVNSVIHFWGPPAKYLGSRSNNLNEGVLLASKNPVMRAQMALQGGIGVAGCEYRVGLYYFDGTTERTAVLQYLGGTTTHLAAAWYDGSVWTRDETDFTPSIGDEILAEIAMDSSGLSIRISPDGGRNWSSTAHVSFVSPPAVAFCPYFFVANGANVGAVMDVYGWSVTQD